MLLELINLILNMELYKMEFFRIPRDKNGNLIIYALLFW